MPDVINLYCDESCHLENDGLPVMGFGALWCPAAHLTTVTQELAALKEKHRAQAKGAWPCFVSFSALTLTSRF